MLEQLRMQEVSSVVLSMPKGAIIPGKDYYEGEPIMIIKNPSLSSLSFVSRGIDSNSAKGHLGESGITTNLDFTINDGAVLFALWSYLYGTIEDENPSAKVVRGTEYVTPTNGIIWLKELPKEDSILYFYEAKDNEKIRIHATDFDFVHSVDEETGEIKCGLDYKNVEEDGVYLVSYEYYIQPLNITTVKQIHNNIFCSIDIYIDAVDLLNDDKHQVCIHCDKVQIDTNMVLSINNSESASFTPIHIRSIPEGNELNKDVAIITVV